MEAGTKQRPDAQMTTGYREVEIGGPGIGYVMSRLALGNSLARLITKRTLHGRCITYLPNEVDVELGLNFDEGGIARASAATAWLSAAIQSYLQRRPENIVVFEDALSQRGDPVLERCTSRVHYFGQEVYHLLGHDDLNEEFIEATIAAADSPHQLVCIFTRDVDSSGETSEISNSRLHAWVRSVEAVATSAFDSEGFIILER